MCDGFNVFVCVSLLTIPVTFDKIQLKPSLQWFTVSYPIIIYVTQQEENVDPRSFHLDSDLQSFLGLCFLCVPKGKSLYIYALYKIVNLKLKIVKMLCSSTFKTSWTVYI